jgi:hypothetical protein
MEPDEPLPGLRKVGKEGQAEMSDSVPAGELFFEKQRRIERELMAMIQLVGEKDVEIARLREALGAVVVACDEKGHCQTMKDIRKIALGAMERGTN